MFLDEARDVGGYVLTMVRSNASELMTDVRRGRIGFVAFHITKGCAQAIPVNGTKHAVIPG